MKLEDGFAEHPKVELAGDEAAWMYVSGLLYAYRANTDGFVPAAKVPKLTGLRSPQKLADRLVNARLWEPVEDGYLIHDYLEHQQSSSEREEQRQANAERARRAREKKRQRNGDVTPLQERTQRGSNADVTSTEGDIENYTGINGSGVPHPLDSSNVVDLANGEGATKGRAA